MDRNSGAAIKPPLIELLYLRFATISCLGPFKYCVVGVVIACIAAPVGIDVVPIFHQHGLQLLRDK